MRRNGRELIAARARRAALAALAAGLLAGLGGCDPGSQEQRGRASGSERSAAGESRSAPSQRGEPVAGRASGAGLEVAVLPRPTVNVVIYLIDTLRADRLGVYGYTRPTSPNIDALGRDAVVFERAQAPAPWTLPSVVSILTSTFLCEHGVVSEGAKLSPAIRTLAERLKSVGYHTVSLYVNDFVGPVSGLNRGYDVCRKFPLVVDASDVREAVRARGDRPLLVYVHNIEPHNPFNAEYRTIRMFGQVADFQVERMSRLLSYYRRFQRLNWPENRPRRAGDNSPRQQVLLNTLHGMLREHNVLYDAVVREADERLGRVVEALQREGMWDNTLFILLSDHGEELAEHGAYLHSQSVYQELTWVPLLIRFPGNEHAGKRISPVVSLVDVLPTICDYLGRPDLARGARGRSLLPLIRGEEAGEPLVLTTVRENVKKYFTPWAETRGDRNLAVFTRDGRWKGIWNLDLNTFELYELPTDPTEQHNLAGRNPQMLGAMYEFARPWYEACLSARQQGEQVPLEQIDEQTLRNLAALGYVDLPEQDAEQMEREVEQLEKTTPDKP